MDCILCFILGGCVGLLIASLLRANEDDEE